MLIRIDEEPHDVADETVPKIVTTLSLDKDTDTDTDNDVNGPTPELN